MYNGSNTLSCAETRASQWKKMKKKNTQRLMPDDDTLNQICYRANYLVYCQSTSNSAVIPLQWEKFLVEEGWNSSVKKIK